MTNHNLKFFPFVGPVLVVEVDDDGDRIEGLDLLYDRYTEIDTNVAICDYINLMKSKPLVSQSVIDALRERLSEL